MKSKSLLGVVISVVLALILCSCISNDIQSINIEPSKTMTVGDSLKINVTYQPENVSQKGIMWSSSNDTIATVNDGTVRANKTGEADITLTAPNGKTATCHITVKDVDITKILISPSSVQIKKGNQTDLYAKVFPSAAGNVDLEWLSNNDYVATVDSNGNVSGLHKGTAIISCLAPNGKQASCTVKVTAKKKKTTSKKAKTKSKSKNKTVNNYYINGHYTPDYIVNRYSSDFVFPYSSSSYLSRSEVSGLSRSLIQKAINEIYARNGYVFKNKTIRSYYRQFSWYYEDPGFSTSDFNSYEKSNLALLQKYR